MPEINSLVTDCPCGASRGLGLVVQVQAKDLPHAVALIERIQSYCESNNVPYPHAFDLYALASVAGKEAIPALREIAAWPLDTAPGNRCQPSKLSVKLVLKSVITLV